MLAARVTFRPQVLSQQKPCPGLQEYADADNAKQRPIMIHRAVFGSIERFFGILLENYAGAFPLWLAPVQVVSTTWEDSNLTIT